MSIFTQGMFQIPANLTPEELKERRKRLEKVMPKFGSARYVGEGIGHAITGAVAGFKGRKLDAAERESRSSAEQMMRDLFGLPGDGGETYSGGASSGGGAGGGFSILGSTPESGGGAEPWADADNPTLAMLREFEGFRGKPYWDVNALRAGYGSDTVTMPDGSVVPVGAGTTVDREAAERDLMRRVSTEFEPAVVKAVGQDVFARLSPQQRAALTSLSYNYGAGAWSDDLSDVAAAARSGDPGAVAAAINALGGHNDGINRRRREREAAAFLSGAAPGMTTGAGLAEAVMPPMDGGAAPVASAKGQPLGMIGGVRGDGGYWQSLDGDGLAHAANPGYTDYSQLFRDYTFEQKPGYVPVGERDGQTVYAAPDYLRGEDGNYMPVSAADAQRLAAERGGLVPTRDEVAALLGAATNIPMPTQPIGETGGAGDPVAYTAAITEALGGQAPTGPIAHGKEFFAPEMGGQPPAATPAAPMEPPTSPLVPRPTPAQYTPRGGGNRPTNQQLLGALMNPWITPDQKAVIQYMLAENQRAAELSAPKQPDMKWIAGVGLVDMNNPPPELMAGNFQAPEGEGVGVQSASPLPDMSGVLMPMKDGSILVRTAGGEELTGQAAMDFIKRANETYAQQQREIYGARREGTLGADIEMGGEAAASRKAGEIAQEAGYEAYQALGKASIALGNYEEAISAIDRGAKSGMIYNMLPSITESSASLENAMNRLGLDVIGSVTFGALSEGEMKLAMETAVPRNLEPPELREWLVRKRDAQVKAIDALNRAATYLSTPGNTLQSWMAERGATEAGQGAPTAPTAAPSAPTAQPGSAGDVPAAFASNQTIKNMATEVGVSVEEYWAILPDEEKAKWRN